MRSLAVDARSLDGARVLICAGILIETEPSSRRQVREVRHAA
jgi:hypothetical protein